MNTRIKTHKAREFRKNPTISEKLLWNELRNRLFMDLKFRRQYIIDGYILDFYCPELNLAIEIDGPIHNKQSEEDKYRQSAIEHSGITFFRVKSEQVENDITSVLNDLSMTITNLKINK
ncbi:MAG: endonuclease domain-containing protein [Candidatus Latescibacteria bacterium]|nr:endonuclease domain-containing protein [Candidatus Latescibacterota bacterium]